MTTAIPARAPTVVRAASLSDSIKVEPLTCAIGAELSMERAGIVGDHPF